VGSDFEKGLLKDINQLKTISIRGARFKVIGMLKRLYFWQQTGFKGFNPIQLARSLFTAPNITP
jgi:hypothetical protein